MKRRGSWQINFIVRALTGMGSIFLVNQWMDYRNIPVSVGLNVLSIFGVRMSWNSGSCHALWVLCFISLCRCCAKRFFLVLKLWYKGKSGRI